MSPGGHALQDWLGVGRVTQGELWSIFLALAATIMQVCASSAWDLRLAAACCLIQRRNKLFCLVTGRLSRQTDKA